MIEKPKKKIIVSGWPKSGNTWVTRLIAELVGCPVNGFFGSNHDEIAVEGLSRISDFSCYKAHQLYSDLPTQTDCDDVFIVYVIRDPRDIAVSGANFFKFSRLRNFNRLIDFPPRGKNLIRDLTETAWFRQLFYSETYRISEMLKAIIYGSDELHYWCRTSWADHYKSFLNSGCLFVRYESLKTNPREQCRNILNFLSLHKSDEEICRSIDNQSFEVKKTHYVKLGEIDKANFLRVGTSGQWKTKLTAYQKALVYKELNDDLKIFGYE